jgi:Protein of unknown function (DUF3828)
MIIFFFHLILDYLFFTHKFSRMKQLMHIFPLIIAIFLSACSNNKPNEAKAEKVATPMVGGDLDAHGCKASAGYTWSVVKNECIRLFEVGIRLDAQAANIDKTTSASVVFKSDDDDAQAELFLPNEKTSILLAKEKKEDAGTWKNEKYTLTQWKGMYSLEDSKKTLLYQGAALPAEDIIPENVENKAITESLHRFFKWYTAQEVRLGKINYVNEKGKHLALDEKELKRYLAELKKSGFVSDELLANETKFLRACAKVWQTESKDEVPTGLGADRFLCAQDFVAPYETGAVTSTVNGDKAAATLTLTGEMGEKSAFQFDMVKVNGKWLLAKLGCNSGVDY